MAAEDDALSAFQSSGLIDVLKWGAPVAFTATDQLYDEDQGHDQGVVGYLNFKHFKDSNLGETDQTFRVGRAAWGVLFHLEALAAAVLPRSDGTRLRLERSAPR